MSRNELRTALGLVKLVWVCVCELFEAKRLESDFKCSNISFRPFQFKYINHRSQWENSTNFTKPKAVLSSIRSKFSKYFYFKGPEIVHRIFLHSDIHS